MVLATSTKGTCSRAKQTPFQWTREKDPPIQGKYTPFQGTISKETPFWSPRPRRAPVREEDAPIQKRKRHHFRGNTHRFSGHNVERSTVSGGTSTKGTCSRVKETYSGETRNVSEDDFEKNTVSVGMSTEGTCSRAKHTPFQETRPRMKQRSGGGVLMSEVPL